MTTTFTNPLRYIDGVTRTDPDPFVIRHRGRYYCYSTGETQVNVSVSDDMITWERLGAALQHDDRWQYWAPCVYYFNGTFYMYVSNRPAGSEDPHEEVLQLATSDNPAGPFETQHTFFSTFSIDPHVVPDGRGSWTMFYSVNDVTGLDNTYTGTSIVGDQLIKFDELAGDPRPIINPTLDEEIFEPNRFGDGRDWYTIEGATYFTRNGYAYMTYSGNAYEQENYFIGYARAPLTGAAPHELEWEKFPNNHTWHPLIRRNDDVEGTGHNSVVRAPNLIDDWIVYHGRDAHQPITPGVEERVMRMDALRYVGNELVTDAPTSTPQPAPARPTVFSRFDGPELDAGWKHRGDGALNFTESGLAMDTGLNTVLSDHQTDAYVAEVWFQMQQSDLGARAGFILSWHDEHNFSEALVDAWRKRLIIRNWVGGVGTEVAAVPLENLDFNAWHALNVTRRYEEYVVTLNDYPTARATLSPYPGKTGVVAVHTRTTFDAFTLTDHVTLAGAELGQIGAPFTAEPAVLVTEAGLTTAGSTEMHLRADRPVDTVTTHTFELLSPTSSVRLTPWSDETGNRLEVKLSRSDASITLIYGEEVIDSVQIERSGAATASVQTAHTAHGFHVYIDTWGGKFTAPTPKTAPQTHQFSQKIALTRSRLTRYEETDLSQSTQAVAKEQ